MAFWKEQLAGRLPVLALPADRPRPKAQGFRGRKLAFQLDAALSRQLEARARSQGASLFMALLTGYAVLLSRTAAQDEVVIGCPTAGRDRRELEPLIGFFVNPLAIRLNLAGAADFMALLTRVRTTVLAAYAHTRRCLSSRWSRPCIRRAIRRARRFSRRCWFSSRHSRPQPPPRA